MFLVLWSIGMTKFWAREEAAYANKWGMDRHDMGSGLTEPLNPSFHGVKKPSSVDENMLELQPDRFKRGLGYVVSTFVSVLFTGVILAGVCANRSWASTAGDTYQKVTALALSAQIQLGDKIWDFLLVDGLNNMEQHTTLYKIDQARIAKSFAVKFVNASVAFLYMAYIQPQIDPAACGEDCTVYLRSQLIFVFGTYIAFGLLDVGMPLLQLKITTWWEARQAQKLGYEAFNISMLEQQALMTEFKGTDEQDCYLAIILPLGYIMMFGTILPSMVFLAYASFSFQLRLHAWKFSGLVRRTFPVRAQGIGTWDTILPWVVSFGNLNSIGMMIITIDEVCTYFPGFGCITGFLDIPINGNGAKVILFLILQHMLIAWHRLLDLALSDTKQVTELEKKRQALQRARMVHTRHAKQILKIELACTGDTAACAFDEIAPLKEGDELYVAPMVQV